MSIFHCTICDKDIDSDYHTLCNIDGLEVCEDCHEEQK